MSLQPSPTRNTNNLHAMSPSEWRLWLCCHPTLTPPPSSQNQNDTLSLEEFDPRNRLSMSRAYGHHDRASLATSPAPSTPMGDRRRRRSRSIEPKRPAVAARLPELTPRAARQRQEESGSARGDAGVGIDGRVRQRPETVLLPSPVLRPSGSRSQGTKTAKKGVKEEQRTPPTFVRQDSEGGNQWWQVGRRMLERRDKEELSPRREGGWERK